mmetsp:Transcript_31003/g.60480  ORF Transcript_31003/g.60480 Transcript_31003/m.60480 type:complete len:434 (-) Transcript_31003:175-1476(-)
MLANQNRSNSSDRHISPYRVTPNGLHDLRRPSTASSSLRNRIARYSRSDRPSSAVSFQSVSHSHEVSRTHAASEECSSEEEEEDEEYNSVGSPSGALFGATEFGELQEQKQQQQQPFKVVPGSFEGADSNELDPYTSSPSSQRLWAPPYMRTLQPATNLRQNHSSSNNTSTNTDTTTNFVCSGSSNNHTGKINNHNITSNATALDLIRQIADDVEEENHQAHQPWVAQKRTTTNNSLHPESPVFSHPCQQLELALGRDKQQHVDPFLQATSCRVAAANVRLDRRKKQAEQLGSAAALEVQNFVVSRVVHANQLATNLEVNRFYKALVVQTKLSEPGQFCVRVYQNEPRVHLRDLSIESFVREMARLRQKRDAMLDSSEVRDKKLAQARAHNTEPEAVASQVYVNLKALLLDTLQLTDTLQLQVDTLRGKGIRS